MEHTEDQGQQEYLERLHRESYEDMERRFVRVNFEHVLESSQPDEQKALLQEADLHAVLFGVKPATRLDESPEMSERILDLVVSNEFLGKKFRAAETTGEFEKEGTRTYKGLIYDLEAVRRLVESDQELFTALGYDPADPEAIVKKALAGPSDTGRKVEAGLLLGYPRPEVFAGAAWRDDESWKKIRSVLPEDSVRATEQLVREFREKADSSGKTDVAGNGERPESEGQGTHAVDANSMAWNEFEENAKSRASRNYMVDAYSRSGFGEVLLKWYHKHPELFPKEETPDWLKKITG